MNSYYLVSHRFLSQLTNTRHDTILSNNYISKKSNPFVSSKDSSLIYFQKRSFLTTPSPQSVNLLFKGLFIYLLLYFSYKYLSKREDRGPRLEIIENHCFSPFHINSILSLIYPKLLNTFQKHSNIYIPNKYSTKQNIESDHNIHSLITNPDNNYNINIHQKIWIDEDNFGDKNMKRYNKFFSKSWLHNFNFEMETLSFNQINFEITDIIQKWFKFNNLLPHSFSFSPEHNTNPLDDIDTPNEIENQEKSEENNQDNIIKPGIRMTLASTLRFDDELRYKFNIIDATQVPFSEIAYFKTDTFSEYLHSDIRNYKYMKYQDHEIVVIPFANNDNLSLILSLPILDYNFILNDTENKKYTKDQKYIKFCIHPHDLHHIFDSMPKQIFEDEMDTKEEKEMDIDDMDNDNILHEELLQLYIPKVDREFASQLTDHHIVSVGLNTFWLPLYYSNLCLKSMDCKSYFNMNENNAKFELLSVGYFDNEKRVWAAMRWKYGLREAALKMNWYNFKQKFKWRKNKEKQDINNKEFRTIIFDRPFDYYLYDSYNQIVYASGTVSA